MSYAESALCFFLVAINAWSLKRRIKVQEQELDRLRKDIVTTVVRQHHLLSDITKLCNQTTDLAKICFEATRRIEELEREVAAYRTVGWMREVRRN